MGQTCFFIGHRDAPEAIYPALEAAVEQSITEWRINCFVVGQFGAFDRMAARAVKAAKQKYPFARLLLLLPYHPAEKPVSVPPGFDHTYYPTGMERVPRRFAIVQANRHMAQHCDALLAYVWHPASNAREILRLAARRDDIRIWNLAEAMFRTDDGAGARRGRGNW